GGRGGAVAGELAPARGGGVETPVARRPGAAEEELVARRALGDAADLGAADAHRRGIDRFQRRRVFGNVLDVGLVVVIAAGEFQRPAAQCPAVGAYGIHAGGTGVHG